MVKSVDQYSSSPGWCPQITCFEHNQKIFSLLLWEYRNHKIFPFKMWESEKYDIVTLHVFMDWYFKENLNGKPWGEFKSGLNNVRSWTDCAWIYRVGIDDLLYWDVDDRLAESNHVWVFINIKLLLRFRDITCCLKKYPGRGRIRVVSRD